MSILDTRLKVSSIDSSLILTKLSFLFLYPSAATKDHSYLFSNVISRALIYNNLHSVFHFAKKKILTCLSLPPYGIYFVACQLKQTKQHGLGTSSLYWNVADPFSLLLQDFLQLPLGWFFFTDHFHKSLLPT